MPNLPRAAGPSLAQGTSLSPMSKMRTRTDTRRAFCAFAFDHYSLTLSDTRRHLPPERWDRLCKELLCCTQGTMAVPILSLLVLRNLYHDFRAATKAPIADAGGVEQLLLVVAAAWWAATSEELVTDLHPARLRWLGQMSKHEPIDAMLDTCASTFMLIHGRTGHECQQERLLRAVGHFSSPWSSFDDGRLHRLMDQLIIHLPYGANEKLKRYEAQTQGASGGCSLDIQQRSSPNTPRPIRRHSISSTSSVQSPRRHSMLEGTGGHTNMCEDATGGSLHNSDSVLTILTKEAKSFSPSTTMAVLDSSS